MKSKTYKVTYKKNKPSFIVNLGSTQDPRATIIGNTQFSKETGTFFQESPFIKAISIPGSVIILDELSRANPEAVNILMPVLDNQRYLRLDEWGGKVVKVAEGVCFIATANIGNEYTATRVMDKALLDRFTVKIEVDTLTQEQELNLVKLIHPNSNVDIMTDVVEIAQSTREFSKSSKISKGVSTRAVVEMAELTVDGFDLEQLAEMVIYPDYPSDGGVDSERTLVKQIVQKYIVASNLKAPSGIKEPDEFPF